MTRRGIIRRGTIRLSLVLAVLVGSLAVIGGASPTAGASTSAAAPSCTFNRGGLPILLNAVAGERVAVHCTGLSPLHPYLLMETSLLLGIDPQAQALLSGNIVSVAGLLAVLAAIPEINTQALSFPFSDLSGTLNTTYTLPSSQAPDPKATCPPTKKEINAGLIGCGLAMIDLTTFKTVGAGSAVVVYKGDPLFPPGPTIALSTSTGRAGKSVTVSDAIGATTYWWLATLSALGALLGGSSSVPPTTTVTFRDRSGHHATAANSITVASAVYHYPVLTPPKISGSFIVPSGVSGVSQVTVSYQASLLAFSLSNSASAPFTVTP